MQPMNNSIQIKLKLKRALQLFEETMYGLGYRIEDCLISGYLTVISIERNAISGRQLKPTENFRLFAERVSTDLFENFEEAKLLIPSSILEEKPFYAFLDEVVQEQFSREILVEILDWIVERIGVEISSMVTPSEVSVLMSQLIEIEPNSSVLDPAMGTGNFYRALKQQPSENVRFVGIEKNQKVSFIASIYAYLMGDTDYSRYTTDAFYFLASEQKKFDHVLCNPPIERISKWEANQKYADVLMGRRYASEMSLNFVQLGLSKLKPGGTAAFLVNMGILFNGNDAREIRQEWIDNGILRAVVALPSKLLSHTYNKCAILLFKNDRTSAGKISFVKADDLYFEFSPTRNKLSEDAFEIIMKRLASPDRSINSAIVDLHEISESNYSIHPDGYVLKEITEIASRVAKHWSKLKDITEIIQGSRDLKSLPEGDIEVIRGENILDMREGCFRFAKVDISARKEKVVFTEAYDILIKRIGEKSAVYVVTPSEPQRLVDQTVFVLRFKSKNPTLVNFVAEFLHSERGSNHIASFCRSTTVQTLTVSVLKEVDVPVPDAPLQSLMMEMILAERNLSKESQKATMLKQEIFNGLGYEKVEGDFDSVRFALKTLELALSQKDNVSYKVASQYPFPIAYAYRNIHIDRESTAVYSNQMKYGELVLSFLVSIGLPLCEYYARTRKLDISKIAIAFQTALDSGISPGHWQSILHSICEFLREIKDCQNAIDFSAIWYKGRGNTLSDFAHLTKSQFVEKLNDHKHHRGPTGSRNCKEAATIHRKIIDTAMLNIEFISQWDFFINDQIKFDSRAQLFDCATSLLKGDHPCFEQRNIRSKHALVDNEIYCDTESEIIGMYPFLHCEYSTNTSQLEIYSLDKKDRKGNYHFKSFVTGHAKQGSTELKERLDKWFDTYCNSDLATER